MRASDLASTAPRPSLPTGTVTFFFTDIEGSTRLLRELGDAYPAVLAEHHRLLREAVLAEGGTPFGSEGDALFAAFPSAARSLAAAARAQRELAEFHAPGGQLVRVRMGVHTGEGTVSEGNYVGIDLHHTARITAAGHGGQVLVSDATRSLVEDSLPAGTSLRDLGEHRLRDLTRSEHLHQLVVDGLRADFPALRTLDATPNNLPTQLTSFVGRDREVAEAQRLLTGNRLLTLTGPGGMGKTRLSLQLAAQSVGEFPDGAFFVPLAPVGDPDLVASTIVQTLRLGDTGARSPIERLVDHLRTRRTLLVLDNFEQILPAAPLVAELLRAAPGLKIVVSSRAALHLSGEQEFPVPPLGVPDPRHLPDLVALSQFEAVSLFIQRAVAVKPDFAVTNENAPAVAEICVRLDGLPLAIELAAARVKLLPPKAMLARLESRLALLVGTARDLPARQQTLRGAIAWSYDLLDEPSRRLFAWLSIFVGGATLEAIEAICGARGDLGLDLLEGLGSLVDQSLIRADETANEQRFWMLATIREYAVERLIASGESESVAAAHAEFYLRLAEETASSLTSSGRKALLDRLDREYGNLRAALSWALDHREAETGLRLGAALWRFWQMRGLLPEGDEWLARVLALAPDQATAGVAEVGPEVSPNVGIMEAKRGALEAAGGVAYWRADLDRARRFYRSALELARSSPDPSAVATALYNLSFPDLLSGTDVDHGMSLVDESLSMFRKLGDRSGIARALWAKANTLYFQERYSLAGELLEECLSMERQLDDPFSLAWCLHTLGLVRSHLGDNETAVRHWQEALDLFVTASDISGVALILGDFAFGAMAEGDPMRALRLAGARAALARSSGNDLANLVEDWEGRNPLKEVRMDRAEAERAYAEGQAMTTEQAIDLALGRIR